ncbi:KAP family P-loop NTPase fold protein [Rhodopirellula europaea]|uniref:KAP family P-loop NTPase fold protein n=1 Tax=Rhodopirellula europaea TaxID=1263866 RepID=UPI003D2CAE10|tara:strand:+ start:24672 stop:26600 length:1929 start_codon:yes stop_codon:yes gene_type:complete
MWSDNASAEDFLNFGVIASVIADSVQSNGDAPLSIGVSGAWGVGKSSTLELLSVELKKLDPKPIVVRFEPWRHQKQDNVRAAFAECIANAIIENEGIDDTIKSKARSIVKRANWMRIAGYGLGGALTLATGLPIGGHVGRGISSYADMTDGEITEKDMGDATKIGKDASKEIANLFENEAGRTQSPYENIESICREFGETLEAMKRRLIVLVDDLDRCLPETTIEALEAMRLYFFVPKTVFVIAADEEMLRLAVRKHFEVAGQTLDEQHLQSYYDKLIQLPFRLPSLSEADVVVYMTMLVIGQQARIGPERLSEIRESLCQELGQTWKGSRITRTAIMATVDQDEIEADFEDRIAMVERLAPRLVESRQIGGNPRLIKRFMNSLTVRRSLAKKLRIPHETSESVLAKVLLLQRCGEAAMVRELEIDVLSSVDGKSRLLQQLEREHLDQTEGVSIDDASQDDVDLKSVTLPGEPTVSELWGSTFAKEWVKMSPALADVDLRAAIHVSRGADQVFSQTVKLGPESSELLEALIARPGLAGQLKEQIEQVPAEEAATIMSALIDKMASCNQPDLKDWLNCCTVFSDIHTGQQTLLVSSLSKMRADRWEPAHAVAVRDKPYAQQLQKELSGKLPSNHPAVRAFRQS